MSKNSEWVKDWQKRHPNYHADFMREKRRHYRRLFLDGKIKYAKIPKAYRYFENTRKRR